MTTSSPTASPAHELNLRAVSAFVAVVDRRGVRAAAPQIGISPSGVSRLVSTLGEQLGVELLVREPGRARLSPDGRALLGPARELLRQAQRVVAEAARRSGGRGVPRA